MSAGCPSMRGSPPRPSCRWPSSGSGGWCGAFAAPMTPPEAPETSQTCGSALLDGRVELLQVRDHVVDVGVAVQAGEDHLGARHLGLGVLEVLLERGLVPGQARTLVGLRVAVALNRTRLAADDAVEHGADGVLGA